MLIQLNEQVSVDPAKVSGVSYRELTVLITMDDAKTSEYYVAGATLEEVTNKINDALGYRGPGLLTSIWDRTNPNITNEEVRNWEKSNPGMTDEGVRIWEKS